MLDIAKDIHSLSDFKRRTSRFLEQMHKTGHPVVLTINGKAELVVQDAEGYQQLLDFLDHLGSIAGIRRGLEDVKAKRTRPAKVVLEEFRRRHGLPD
jgi:PHD/YefM family antitoxin component YafN of YafNO toxin-antitoxin module